MKTSQIQDKLCTLCSEESKEKKRDYLKIQMKERAACLIKVEDTSLSGRNSGWRGGANPEDHHETQQAVCFLFKWKKDKGREKGKILILENEKVLIRGNAGCLPEGNSRAEGCVEWVLYERGSCGVRTEDSLLLEKMRELQEALEKISLA